MANNIDISKISIRKRSGYIPIKIKTHLYFTPKKVKIVCSDSSNSKLHF